MKKILTVPTLTVVLFCFIQTAYAQNTPDDMVKKFFSDFTSAGSSTALDNLYATNPWMSKSSDAVSNLKMKIGELSKDFVGDFRGYELIASKPLGDCYVIKSYIVKYDRQPIRFTFQFYKAADKWMVFSFQYDSNLSAEMEDAMKLYYLSFGEQ